MEFTLTPDGDSTHLRVVETGFAALAIPEDRIDTAGYDSHSAGWTEVVGNFQKYAEQLAA